MGLAVIIVVLEIFFATSKHIGWSLLGAIYISLAGYALIELRGNTEIGFATVCWLLVLVWSADIGAYITGQTFKGPKLAPRISPKKTWSGFFGAIFFAGLTGFTIDQIMDLQSVWQIAVLSCFLGALSQYGDLLESWFKRRFNRKDMSNLIPGHGGLTDRVDGLAAAAISLWIYEEVLGNPLLRFLEI